jgi:hypothetical protein
MNPYRAVARQKRGAISLKFKRDWTLPKSKPGKRGPYKKRIAV